MVSTWPLHLYVYPIQYNCCCGFELLIECLGVRHILDHGIINSLARRRNKHDYCTSCLLVPNRVPFPFFSLKKENEKEKCVAHNIIPASIRCLACNTVNILDGIMDMIVEFFTSNRPLISPTHVGHIRYENINMMYVVYHFLVISNYGDINYFKGCMYCHTNQPPKYLCILFGFIHISNYTTSLVPRW